MRTLRSNRSLGASGSGAADSADAAPSLPGAGLATRHDRFTALALYTLISVALSLPILLHLNDQILGPAGGDNLWYAWSVWWFRQAVESGQDPAHTHMIFALLPSVQVFVDGYFNEVVAWPLQWVLEPLAAYNLVIVLSFILSGFTMYLLAGEFIESRLACFTAGFLYDFSTFHFARSAGHLGLLTMQWLPFCAWRLFALYRRPTLPNALLAGLGLALVPLSEVYYLPYFAFPFVAALVVYVLLTHRGWLTSQYNLRLSVVTLIVAGAVALPGLIGYLIVDPDVKAATASYAEQSTEQLSADLAAFVLPNPANPLFGGLTSGVYQRMTSPYPVEEALFLGYPTLALVVAALFFRRNRNRYTLFWLALGLGGLVLALGPELFVAGHAVIRLKLYRAAFGWPILSNFRAPNRLAVLPLMSFSLLAGYAVDTIVSRVAPGTRARFALWCLLGAVLAASLLEHVLWSVELPTIPIPVPALYREIGADRGDGLLLDLPLSPSGAYQFYQTVHHKPLVYGYAPRTTARMVASVESLPYLAAFDLGQAQTSELSQAEQANNLGVKGGFRDMLRGHGITYVVFHRAVDPPTYALMYRFLKRSLGRPFYSSEAEGLTAWRLAGTSSETLHGGR